MGIAPPTDLPADPPSAVIEASKPTHVTQAVVDEISGKPLQTGCKPLEGWAKERAAIAKRWKKETRLEMAGLVGFNRTQGMLMEDAIEAAFRSLCTEQSHSSR